MTTLTGRHIRLEPLSHHHAEGLAAASATGPSLYRWSPVPQDKAEADTYIDTALAWQAPGDAVPFAIVRNSDSAVIGSTRFFSLERWAWPAGHPSYGRAFRTGAPFPTPARSDSPGWPRAQFAPPPTPKAKCSC